MPRTSAGILMYRRSGNRLEVLLVHPGGPFWTNKDAGAWSIPKGEFTEGEDPFTVARREFEEETGFPVNGDFTALTPLKQPSGKLVHAWAVEGDCDAARIRSNSFSMEWPRGSGRHQQFPEVDRAGWFPIPVARQKILKGQAGFLTQLLALLGEQASPKSPGQDDIETSGQGSLFD